MLCVNRSDQLRKNLNYKSIGGVYNIKNLFDTTHSHTVKTPKFLINLFQKNVIKFRHYFDCIIHNRDHIL
jgi:hypothetical protein